MQFQIKNLEYEIENDILKIKDSGEKIYITINLNQIYNLELIKNTIAIYLDNDIVLRIIK